MYLQAPHPAPQKLRDKKEKSLAEQHSHYHTEVEKMERDMEIFQYQH